MKAITNLLLLAWLCWTDAFSPSLAKTCRPTAGVWHPTMGQEPQTIRHAKRQGKQLSDKRRKQLGVADDEDEYDLDVALNANTDSGISKIVAGSFILTMIALLVVGLVIPLTTDYGEGVCNPLLTQGRC